MIRLFEYRVYRTQEEPVPFCWKMLFVLFMLGTLLAMTAVCSSCQPEKDMEDIGVEEDLPATIRLEVRGEEQVDIATRTVNESVVSDLHILVYNSSGELIGQKYQTGSSTVTVNTRSATGCTIYAVANTGKADLFKGYDIHKESHLKEMIYTISSWSELTDGDFLLMTGSKSMVDIIAGSQSLSMEVSRIAAKIILKIGVEANSGITIKDYTIHNLPLCSYYILRPLDTEAKEDDTTYGEDAPTGANNWTDSPVTSLTASTTSMSNTFYMFENRRGVNNSISSQGEKTSANAPANATYLEINGTVANGLVLNWKVYLGANNTSNFNIKRNGQYTYNITLSENFSDTRVSINESEVINLSETETANCYLVSERNKWYKFKATVRGNGTKTIKDISPISGATNDLPAGETMKPTGVELIWETSGHKQMIDSYMLHNGYVYFRTGANVTEGNAVIAVKDATGILWSWHIWKTSFDLAGLNSSHTQTYKTSPKYLTGYNVIRTRYMTMMDRDLGAADNAPSQADNVVNTYGLHYQWGRKDPFPPAKVRSCLDRVGAYGAEMVSIYDASGNLIDPMDATHQVTSVTAGDVGDDITPNIDYGIKHPITFCTRMENDYLGRYSSQSWIYGCYNDGTTTSNRWKKSILLWGSGMKNEASTNYYNSTDTKKSIYDPCPEGWCLPTLEVWSNFTITECITDNPDLYNCTEKRNYSLPNGYMDATVFGREFYINNDNIETAFYPASGFRQGENGTLAYVGQISSAWSSSIFHNSSPNGYGCAILGANHTFTHSVRFAHQSDSFPVRCVKESDMDK